MLLAQTESDFSGWMKQVAKSNGALKGALKGGDLKAAQTEAAALESAFKSVEAYFTKAGMADAAKMAKAAHESAGATAKATSIDAATAASAGVGGSCQGCHGAYREKGADGAYKIKGK
jgi:cytochrome c556